MQSFFRHVAKLPIDFKPWSHYEELAEHSGPRMVHAKFCIISDRPEVLKIDEQNRPHCEDGPSHKWRDGWSLYYFHGVKVTRQIIESPGTLTVADADKADNAEVRRIIIDRMGAEKYLRESGAKLIHEDVETARKGAAPRALVEDKNGDKWLIGRDGSTKKRTYYMPVPNTVKTCKEAHESICGFSEEKILVKS